MHSPKLREQHGGIRVVVGEDEAVTVGLEDAATVGLNEAVTVGLDEGAGTGAEEVNPSTPIGELTGVAVGRKEGESEDAEGAAEEKEGAEEAVAEGAGEVENEKYMLSIKTVQGPSSNGTWKTYCDK